MLDLLYNWNSLLDSVSQLFLLTLLDYKQLFHNHCNIMSGKYKGLAGRRGGVSGQLDPGYILQ